MEREVPGKGMGAVLIEITFAELSCFFKLKGKKMYMQKKCWEKVMWNAVGEMLSDE